VGDQGQPTVVNQGQPAADPGDPAAEPGDPATGRVGADGRLTLSDSQGNQLSNIDPWSQDAYKGDPIEQPNEMKPGASTRGQRAAEVGIDLIRTIFQHPDPGAN
jgi:hypothetical protein